MRRTFFLYLILNVTFLCATNAQIRKDGFVLSSDGTFLEKYEGVERSGIIPGSVTYIGLGAFYGCKTLKFIGIPRSVNKIGHGAFNECKNLKTVFVCWYTPLKLDHNPFSGLNLNKMTLDVPRGTRARYASSNVWKDFGTITEYNPVD